jgi:hypothetical protein
MPDEESSGPTLRFAFPVQDPRSRMSASLNVCFHGAGDLSALTEDQFLRLGCLCLVHQLPVASLREAASQLSQMWEFYSRPPTLSQPVLPSKSVPVIMGPAVIRPIFSVTEED